MYVDGGEKRGGVSTVSGGSANGAGVGAVMTSCVRRSTMTGYGIETDFEPSTPKMKVYS